MNPTEPISGRLRTAGILVILGLLVEALCLAWSRPIAFVIFAVLGGALIVGGVGGFLYSLVSVAPSASNSTERH